MKILPTKMLFVLLLSLAGFSQAADWSVKDTNGAHHSLNTLHGKWVLVNFWAPWCPSCLQEMPGLQAVQKQHPDVQVIGIAVMYKNRQEVMSTVKDQALTYPIVLGGEDIASDFGGMPGMPASFLYMPSGLLLGRHLGPLTLNEIEQAIAQKPEGLALFGH